MASSEEPKKSFTKSMFAGDLDQEIVFPYPKMDPDEEESLRMILDSIREFFKDNVDSA